MTTNNDDRWFVLNDTPSTFKERKSNKALFRYCSFDILLQMLNEKKNYLVKTALWEDVYENFLLKEKLRYKGGTLPREVLINRFFGQCWTRKMASDAIWRIYSPDKKSVRIKTNLGKLYDLGLSFPKDGSGTCLFGKVDYYPQTKIEGDLQTLNQVSQDELSQILLQSLFVKRDHFSHEAEYRLIFMSNRAIKEDIISIPINPLDFIENIYFDPRADDQYVKRCTNILVDAFGYPKEQIHKSELYLFNPLVINIV